MQDIVTLRELLERYSGELALVIGNGINRYGESGTRNSWNDLLTKLANKNKMIGFRVVPDDVALTEFYDILDLNVSKQGETRPNLQEEFCELMSDWQDFEHHRAIVKWCEDQEVPILTTNFDNMLSRVLGNPMQWSTSGRHTDFYPWECHYARVGLTDPTAGFGIWHINGMKKYSRSIRLGLTHYMGSVQRARSWIYPARVRRDERLYQNGGINVWRGKSTWLQVVMGRPLVFFGLGLEGNEVFLRWLLLERAKYLKNARGNKTKAWFVHTHGSMRKGQKLFLEGVGITPLAVGEYDEIYHPDIWSG